MLQIGSLFSGAGLCDLGFHQAGFKHRFFCEIDPYCRSILARHWPGVPIYGDIRTLRGVDLPPVDVLVGGFPCQDVSCAGKRAGITSTTRSGLWTEYARLINEIQPRYAAIENVKGLLSGGLERVLSDLSACGYDAEWASLSAAALGAPHIRERLFILAYPHADGHNRERRILSALKGDMGEIEQPGRISAWLGIQFERASRPAIISAYRGHTLHRVDDGRTTGLDMSGGGQPDRITAITHAERRAWIPRMQALGNGITPAQAYAVARCILRAERLE